MNKTHWHLQPHGEADVEHADTLIDALGIAAEHLDRIAEHEHEQISALGDAGRYKMAYLSFVKANQFTALAANAANVHKQGTVPREERAPLYQDPDEDKNAERVDKAAAHALQEIYRTGPEGFRIWECIVDPCDLKESDVDGNEEKEASH